MKKTILILLALMMMLSLAACGGQAPQSKKSDDKASVNATAIKDALCVDEWGYWEYKNTDKSFANVRFFRFLDNGNAESYTYEINKYTAVLNAKSEGTYKINSDGTISVKLTVESGRELDRTFSYAMDGDTLHIVLMLGYEGDRECHHDEWLERIWGSELSSFKQGSSSMKSGALAHMEENYAEYLFSEDK